jgi:hypothetical protein
MVAVRGADAPGARLVVSPLSTTPGLHRFRWDFTLPGPEGSARAGAGGEGGGGPGRAARGPWVAPGGYQVRLTMGSWTATRPFRILIDPRLPADGITELTLREQLAMSLRARDLVSESRRVVARLVEVRRQAGEAGAGGNDAARRALPKLAAIEARLVTAQGRYPTPMLADQIAFLYGMTLAADQKLGRDVSERYVELAAQLAEVKSALEAIVATDLPSLKAGR